MDQVVLQQNQGMMGLRKSSYLHHNQWVESVNQKYFFYFSKNTEFTLEIKQDHLHFQVKFTAKNEIDQCIFEEEAKSVSKALHQIENQISSYCSSMMVQL